MAVKFSVGDVVRLRSEGPWMTVSKDRPEAGSKFAEVVWFDGSSLKREVLAKDTLEHDPARRMADKKDAGSEG